MSKLFLLKIIAILLFSTSAQAKIERISKQEFDLSKPFTIHMTPKRTTLIKFPCEISHSILGSNEDIQIKIGPDSKSHLILWMPNILSQPTNMIIPCDENEYAFDIYPNTINHQYIIEIVDSFNSEKSKRKIIDGSSHKIKKDLAKRKLIVSSKSKRKPSASKENEILNKLNDNKNYKKLISRGVR